MQTPDFDLNIAWSKKGGCNCLVWKGWNGLGLDTGGLPKSRVGYLVPCGAKVKNDGMCKRCSKKRGFDPPKEIDGREGIPWPLRGDEFGNTLKFKGVEHWIMNDYLGNPRELKKQSKKKKYKGNLEEKLRKIKEENKRLMEENESLKRKEQQRKIRRKMKKMKQSETSDDELITFDV